MDKKDALNISREYLKKVRKSNLDFSEAWLFGSYARGNQNENSDIDIAIILNETGIHSFETDVRLMIIRSDEETLIEPHAFTKDEFSVNIPIVKQILLYGERIAI